MRRPDPSVAERLFDEPYLFDFFQAVRLLERLRPGRFPVGHDGPPRDEVVRFIAHVALKFPPSAVHSLDEVETPPGHRDQGGGPPRMATPFMGLVGAAGVLPTVYTEALMGASGRRNTAARDFLDLFHHRLVSLFYRAWEKYNVPALWERGQRWGNGRVGDDAFSRRLFDLIGLGLEPLRDRLAVPDGALLYYAGFFAQQHRPACVLEALLRDYFGRPAAVVTFQGQWLRLPDDQQSRMGRTGAYNRLGIDTVVGGTVWDDQCKFRVRLGPLGLDDFRLFLPGGRLSAELMDLVRFFAPGELDFDVQLVLKAAEVPGCKLSRDSGAAAQLGRLSWLKRREFTRDAEDAVFRPPLTPLGPGAGRGVDPFQGRKETSDSRTG
jgi:type VI secretion system protein ImpH